MNVPKYTSSRQSATGAAEEYQYLNQLKEDLKMIFYTKFEALSEKKRIELKVPSLFTFSQK